MIFARRFVDGFEIECIFVDADAARLAGFSEADFDDEDDDEQLETDT